MVFDKVTALIANQLPIKPEDIKLESRLLEDLRADSANVMMLVMDIEAEFDITVDDDILGSIRTVGDIVGYLEERL